MKKKLVAMIMVMAVSANLVACGCGTTDNNAGESNVQESSAVEESSVAEEATVTEEEVMSDTSGETAEGDNTQAETGDSIAQALLADFHAKKAETPEITAQEMADALLTNSMIEFSGVTMPVEEGLLTGFSNAEIKGFKEAVMFAPMIGSIPFVGYIFTLEDGADTAAFVQNLKDSANPAWNICTEADETVVENAENMVFFVMSPSYFE